MPGESSRLLPGDGPVASARDAGGHAELPRRAGPVVSARRRAAIFGAVWTGVFLGAVDSTVMATLVSSVSASLGASHQLSWLATAYLLAISATGGLYGKLAELAGRRLAHLLALALFALGTLACALSRSMSQLILARFVAGCGGGGIMTTSSIIASDLVPLERRAWVQGLANLCYGAGAALGGPLGGWLADAWGWRAAFLAQVPVLVLAMVLVGVALEYRLEGQVGSRAEFARRIDVCGSVALVSAMTSLLLCLSFRNNMRCGWSDPRVYGTFVGFAVGAGLFVWVERRAKEPVLPLGLLRLRTPACSVGVNLFSSMVGYSVLYTLPLWFETVKLTSATQAGLHLIPNSVSLSLGSLAAGWCIRRTGRYRGVIMVSSTLMFVGAGLLSFKLDSTAHEWTDVVLNGLGFTASTTAVLIALIASVPEKQMAVATGLSYLFRYVGQVTGVAISGALLQSKLAAELEARITGPDAARVIDAIRHDASMVKRLADRNMQNAAISSYDSAVRRVFGFDLVLSLIAILLSCGIEEFPLSDK